MKLKKKPEKRKKSLLKEALFAFGQLKGASSTFNWGILLFLFRTIILGNYTYQSIFKDNFLLLTILTKTQRHLNYVEIIDFALPTEILLLHPKSNDYAYLVHQFKKILNEYGAEGYSLVYIYINSSKKIIDFLENELEFEKDTEQKLFWILSNQTHNNTILYKEIPL